MRAVFGVLSLLIVVAVVGFLAKKQLSSVAAPPAVTATPGTPAPGATPKQQMDQLKQGLDATLQQPRPMPEDTK